MALLISIAIIGVAAAGAIELGAIYQRRMAEKELLYVGGEFQHALLDYAENTPLGQPTQPRMLDELLLDPRYPNPVRHLRKLYADPMTGKADWVLVKGLDGQTIIGIHSASAAHPIQIAHFPKEFRGFEKKRYTAWVFVARFAQSRPGGALDFPIVGGATAAEATTPDGAASAGGMTRIGGAVPASEP
ncbi:UNVERIFIED_ORG: type II secretory pathway pseudopilin PulG [Paraburkholderia sediminicola]|nr:type II secretory pathway pseudopilin PulG [Paraburkholderia sediminicola]